MNLAAWFRSKNLSAHALAAILLTAASVVSADPQARQFVMATFQRHPSIGAWLIAAAGIAAKYSHSSSAAGTVANANIIKEQPDAPTASQVQAATTK
jgi:hypothetical protein